MRVKLKRSTERLALGRIRLVYLIDKLGPAGAQTHLEALVTGLDPERFWP